MADEIRIAFNVSIANGNFKDTIAPGQINVTQDAVGRGGHVQSIGFAAEEVIDFGDVATEGWLYLRNTDATNYVEWGPEDSGAMVVAGRIEAGEFAWLRLSPGVVVRAQANTAAVLVDVRCYED